MTNQAPYIGRFAPSPSGPLHMGSLVCALASYLDARSHNGTWLVRMEDIDPPREQAGAADLILSCLQKHGLQWDDSDVMFQSTRAQAYNQTLSSLRESALIYPCSCTRKRLNTLNGRYDGYCKTHPATSPAALRLDLEAAKAKGVPLQQAFCDGLQGEQYEDLALQGDFVIHRKDGLFAYQLAVVVDDIAQNITHVVRGSDLLDTTARQRALMQLLGHQPPHYSHIPVLVDANGNKLSKQNHAPAVELDTPTHNLIEALTLLGFDTAELTPANSTSSILHWAIPRWTNVATTLQGRLSL